MKYVIHPSMLYQSIFMVVVEAVLNGDGVCYTSPTTGKLVTKENETMFDSQKDAELFIVRQAEYEIQSMERSIELRRELIAKLKDNVT